MFDAVRFRLVEIGEAVAALPAGLLESEPGIDWKASARSRDLLTNDSLGTARAIVQHVVGRRLDDLVSAAARLKGRAT